MTTIIYLQRHDRKPRGLGIEINKEKSDCLKSGLGAVFFFFSLTRFEKDLLKSITKTPAKMTMLKQRVTPAVKTQAVLYFICGDDSERLKKVEVVK